MSVNPDEIIEAFLDGQPRAELWRDLRQTLADRLADAVTERNALPPGDNNRDLLEKRIQELRDQVAALAQEEAITKFVEDSVRASFVRPRPAPGAGAAAAAAEGDDPYGYGDNDEDSY